MAKSKREALDPNDPDYLVKAREAYLEDEKEHIQAAMSAAADETDEPFPSPLTIDPDETETPAGMAGGKAPKGADDTATRTFPDAPDRGEDVHGAKKGKK